MINLFNIGFTRKTAKEFFGIIKANKIDCLVDVRLNPNGQLSRFAFEQDLPYFLSELANGCKYKHRVDLAPTKELLKEVEYTEHPIRLIGLSVSNPVKEEPHTKDRWEQLSFEFSDWK